MLDLNVILTEEKKAELKISAFAYTEESQALYYKEYLDWINKKNHLPLKYLADHRAEIRSDLKKYFPEFQSAIVLLFSYSDVSFALKNEFEKNHFKTRLGAFTLGFEGLDYHYFLKQKLELVALELKKYQPDLKYQFSLDVHPVLERDLGIRSGLGWIGKNSMLINKDIGSFFIVASILIDQKCNYIEKKMEVDHCGKCTKCIDACPTDAIDLEKRIIKAIDCISTFTIEEFKLDTIASPKMTLDSGYIFGCDICQDVCPWNIRQERNGLINKIKFNEKQKNIIDFFMVKNPHLLKEKIEDLSNNEFKKLFKNTSFERSGKRGILKNIIFYLKNK